MSLWPVGILNLVGHKENYWFTSECVAVFNLGLLSQGVERFHMTSRRPCWCLKPILWELNSFLMPPLSFVPINLDRC